MFDALATESFNPPGAETVHLSIADKGLLLNQIGFDQVYRNADELAQEDETIVNLESLIASVAAYGVTRSLLCFSNRGRLLTSAFPTLASCEALNTDVAANDPKAIAAQEEIVETVKNFAASWFKKAWDVIADLGHKIAEHAKLVYDKAEEAVKWAAQKTFDAAKAAKETIKAHPVASIIAGLATLAAVAAALMAIWGMPLPVSMATMGSWRTSVIDKMKTVGSGIIEVSEVGVKQIGKVAGVVRDGVAAGLGYTKDGFTNLTKAVKDTFSEGGKVHGFSKWIALHAKASFEEVSKLPGEAYGAGREALGWLMRVTTAAWRAVSGPVGGWVASGYAAFKGLFMNDHGSMGKHPPGQRPVGAL